ncbi:hypothetical protein CMQ_6159 [Grosmannia clavigera kw1407]|uniref:Uncharacterized protein n=1 Tax=Grosmannia clavigera (strain kw1407 / UAMH 11150) TaxID=655863 RepID=F0XLP3_GROCL|nr:uncharacterized protein CMQ_6159 [Grosmannia clavigera kw1407]EFX01217.1 hypothetical protein CMQ_6159 [Grosmannia clavigera kw1407]
MNLAGSAPLSGGTSSQGHVLAPPFEHTPVTAALTSAKPSVKGKKEESGESATGSDDNKKHKKRGLFGFGKKKGDETSATSLSVPSASAAASASAGTSTTTMSGQTTLNINASAATGSVVPPQTPGGPSALLRKPSSPFQAENYMGASIASMGSTSGGSFGHGYYVLPTSPGRTAAGLSSSPRVSSPAGSQIFERDVQESALLVPNSPAIPSHITTEDRIPSVLDASSEVITDDHLDPDSVEIITHAHHQPAVMAVAGMGNAAPVASSAASGVSTGAWVDDVASSFVDKDDSASNYGSFDATDIRRLSFISLTTLSTAVNRSPSPMRSPTATATSPPTSKSGSIKGLELSPPSRKATMGSTYSSAVGSPTMSAVGSTGSNALLGGELAIETMTQALRRTGSGDLSGVRSLPQSPIEGTWR